MRPPAQHATLSNLVVERLRSGDVLEPTAPGSRGLLVFQATGTTVRNSLFRGNYEDHIHLPASATVVLNNEVSGATHLGIAIIQETAGSLSVANVLIGNRVSASGNVVRANHLDGNALGAIGDFGEGNVIQGQDE